MRAFPIEELIVFYEVADPGIRIVRVWDGRRDPAKFNE